MPAEAAIPPAVSQTAWPQGPAAALPRTVAAFHGETVASYIDRSRAPTTSIPPHLRRYLTDPRTDCHPQPGWLATASDQSLTLLRTRLIGLTERDRDLSRQRHHARPVIAAFAVMATAVAVYWTTHRRPVTGKERHRQ